MNCNQNKQIIVRVFKFWRNGCFLFFLTSSITFEIQKLHYTKFSVKSHIFAKG